MERTCVNTLDSLHPLPESVSPHPTLRRPRSATGGLGLRASLGCEWWRALATYSHYLIERNTCRQSRLNLRNLIKGNRSFSAMGTNQLKRSRDKTVTASKKTRATKAKEAAAAKAGKPLLPVQQAKFADRVVLTLGWRWVKSFIPICSAPMGLHDTALLSF